MSRLPLLTPDALRPDQREVYDAIVGGPRSGSQVGGLTHGDGSLIGPFNAMLYNPAVGDAMQRLGAAIRFETGFSARARELAILTVAAHWDSEFERYAHEAIGRRAGLTDTEMAAIRSGAMPMLTDPIEQCVVATTRRLLADRDLDDTGYTMARSIIGERAIVELTALVGLYTALALQLRVFRVTP